MLAQEYWEGQSCKIKSLENSNNNFHFSFGLEMPYTNQCFLVEVATSPSCLMHTQVCEFPYCDGNLIGTKFAHIYFNRWPLDDHDDCILVAQTYKKLHIVIYG